MSNWFHRNPFKATSKVTFDLGSVAKTIQARSICSELGSKRANLLKVLANPAVTQESLLSAANQYFPLLLGFIEVPEGAPAAVKPAASEDDETAAITGGGGGDPSVSKLRGFITFKWTNSIRPKSEPATEQADAVFELCSMLYMVALWYAKHAAKITAKEVVSDEDAKEIFTSLRSSAGIFKMILDEYVSKLLVKPVKCTDLDSDALTACVSQFTAEAQEVTVGRAIEMKHSPALIAGLAYETSQTFNKAFLALNLYEAKVVDKMRKYFKFKEACYKSYALVFHAEDLLVQEKAGQALGIMVKAEENHKLAEMESRAYAKSQGVGISSRPAEHAFFRRLGPLIARVKTKVADQNTILFHQKAVPCASDPVLKASHGLVDPTPPHLTMTLDDHWKEGYAGFDEKKLAESIVQRQKKAKESKHQSDREAPVEHVSEPPIFQTDKDPKNDSGCIIS